MIFNKQELEQLEALCPNASVILNRDDPTPSSTKEYPQNVYSLVDRIKGHLTSMMEEKKEYESEIESERLRAESVGLLIALREIQATFPELRKT